MYFTCILAGENKKIKIFDKFSSNLGLAFQIKDDLLDVEGNEKEIGKKTQKDSSKGKETLISLMGKEKARKSPEELIANSLKILKKFGKDAENLINLTNFIISRKQMTSNVENESFINKFKNVRLDDALLVDTKFVSSRKEGHSL